MFFGPQSVSFDDQDMIYHNDKQLSLKSGGLTKFTLMLQINELFTLHQPHVLGRGYFSAVHTVCSGNTQ